MEAGKLKYQITLYKETQTMSDDGSVTWKYVKRGTTRAALQNGKGWRTVVQDEIVYQRALYFSVRDYVTVENTDLVKYKNSLYRILGTKHDDDKMCIELTCEEVVDTDSYVLEEE